MINHPLADKLNQTRQEVLDQSGGDPHAMLAALRQKTEDTDELAGWKVISMPPQAREDLPPSMNALP